MRSGLSYSRAHSLFLRGSTPPSVWSESDIDFTDTHYLFRNVISIGTVPVRPHAELRCVDLYMRLPETSSFFRKTRMPRKFAKQLESLSNGGSSEGKTKLCASSTDSSHATHRLNRCPSLMRRPWVECLTPSRNSQASTLLSSVLIFEANDIVLAQIGP